MADEDKAASARFFLGRQPILDLGGNVSGYELLFRSCADNVAYIIDDYHATIEVIARAFSELGIQSVIGDTLGFINLDTKLLTCEIADVLPFDRVVLELLETTVLGPETIECCRVLHEKGFRLALDDVTALSSEHHALLPYVSYVKVDLLGMSEDILRALVAQLRPLKLKLLAEKVETQQQHELCRELGFELFQGYYFARPEILSGRSISPAHQQMLRLSQLLMSDASDAKIEAVFKEDSKLTYNLLRLVNSVAMGLRTHISSVRHAMQLLGRLQLQRWLSLLLFAHRDGAKFPDPLAIMAACRGRMMELLARTAGLNDVADQAFMTGVMSLLEAVLEIPMDRIVTELNLAEPIRLALIRRAGKLGQLLTLVEAVEAYDIPRITEQITGLGLTIDQLTTLEIDAMNWANAIGQEK